MVPPFADPPDLRRRCPRRRGEGVHGLGQTTGRDQADQFVRSRLLPEGEQGPDEIAHRLRKDVGRVEQCHLDPSQDVIDVIGRSPRLPEEGWAAEGAGLVAVVRTMVKGPRASRSSSSAIGRGSPGFRCGPAWGRAGRRGRRDDLRWCPPTRQIAPRAALATMGPRPPGP